MLQLLVQLPNEETRQRLLDGAPLPEVAREPGVYLFVIRDGSVHPVARTDRP